MAFRNAIKWAIVYTLASVIWVFFEKLFGWRTTNIGVQAIYSNFYFLISLLIYFLAFRDQFKKEGSALRWNKGFGFGVKLTFIIVLFVPFYQLLVSYIITPDFFSYAIKYAVEKGSLNQMEAENYFSIKHAIFLGGFTKLTTGLVFSAIMASLAQKKHPEFLG